MSENTDTVLHTFWNAMRDRFGLKATRVRGGLVLEKIAERTRVHGHRSTEEYTQRFAAGELKSSEYAFWASEVTVNETYFFRNSNDWNAVRYNFLPAVAQRRQGPRHARILSLGCASGEEAWTAALVLLREFPQLIDPSSPIMAGDIDLSLLEVGSNGGPYSERSMQLVEPALRQQYFCTQDKRWYICEEIRKLVSFRYVNLNKIGETLRGREFDLIFCRNVLIYFDAPAAHAALHAVTRLLSPEGHLIIGHSEGTLAQEAGLTPQIVNGCLAIPAAALHDGARNTPDTKTTAQHPLHRLTRMPASVHPTTSVTGHAEHGEEWHPLPDLIRNARTLISDGRLEDARRELKHVLLRDRTSPDARYLLGMLHLGSGELHDALGEFERIISWHETHAMARLQAALVLGRLGNIQAAETHRQRLLDILAHSPDDELIDQEEGITVGFARLLCMNPFDTHTTN